MFKILIKKSHFYISNFEENHNLKTVLMKNKRGPEFRYKRLQELKQKRLARKHQYSVLNSRERSLENDSRGHTRNQTHTHLPQVDSYHQMPDDEVELEDLVEFEQKGILFR